nr:type IV secretion system protein [Phyllobacterium myrsinacearum]
MVFWGFRFWQGRGESSVVDIAFRFLRIAIIFSIATGWGPIQTLAYGVISGIPMAISSVMMNNIVNTGRGSMSQMTVERDLYDFYQIALLASTRISSPFPDKAAPDPVLKQAAVNTNPPSKSAVGNKGMPDDVLLSSLHSGIVWIAAALFVAYAIFLMLFSKLALWIVLALAPGFIVTLLFRGASRFFSGWLTVAIQTMLVPIFFYAFLSFFMIIIKDVVITLKISTDHGAVPTIREIAPFVLVCFAGLFLLAQIVPLSARIAGGAQKWVGDALQGGVERALPTSFANGKSDGGTANGKTTRLNMVPSGMQAPPQGSQSSMSEMNDTLIRDIQDRNLAINRQSGNR